MARLSKHIVIEGQYASGVLGTFRIIRGFATLQDLAAISAPFQMTPADGGNGQVQGHQRAPWPEHAEEIKRYLQDGKLRFIPEVILSVRGEFMDELDATQKQIGIRGTGVDGIKVKRRFKSPSIRTHLIEVEKAKIAQLVTQERRIRRIDGNHRLHLADQLTPDVPDGTKYLAPFCAILLQPPGDANDDYVESMLFHTINSTALPLDSEHALTLILGQGAGLGQSPDDEFALSAPLHLTRLLKAKIAGFPNPQKAKLGPTPNKVLHASAKAMLAANASIKSNRNAMGDYATDMTAALNEILSRLPPTFPEFCKADLFIELAALAWHEAASGSHDERVSATVEKLEGIAKWLGQGGLHQLKDDGHSSLAMQLFKLYQAVQDRVPKRVFLARWYPDDSDGANLKRATYRLNELKKVCDALKLELIDMGTRVGGTYDIPTQMYTAIQSSDIFAADLTGIRPNVMIEIGYGLRHHERGRMILFHEKRKGESIPFDIRGFQYIPLDQAVEIGTKVKTALEAILTNATAGQI